MFYITKIEIGEDCKWTKILSPGEYRLVEDNAGLNQWLYGRNIMVSAIVGMNGSGKSSLMEMIFRVLNNFCAMFCESKRINSNPFRYIYFVYASLHFQSDNGPGIIVCYDNTVLVKLDGSLKFKVGFGDGVLPDGFTRLEEVDDHAVENLISGLFYCIAVNYAPYAFNSNDFSSETCAAVENMIPGRINLNRHNWFDATFHKNDGYFSNITLVPFRNSGNFNAQKELNLARARILELLISYPDFIEGYVFEDANIKLDEDPLRNKFSKTTPSYENNYSPNYDTPSLIQDFEVILTDFIKRDKESIAGAILNVVCPEEVTGEKELTPIRLLSLLYIVYKVLSCSKYPSMGFSDSRFKTDMTFEKGEERDRKDAAILASHVMADDSHITVKIKQTLNFLEICDIYAFSNIKSKPIQLSYYWHLLKFNREGANIFEIAKHLPPPFLIPDVYLKRGSEYVSINEMSTGEKQFYNTVSSVAYHLMNLISIGGSFNRIPYKNALVILDEVELCYHPEYQRTFVNSLVSMIERLGFNRDLSIHFLLTTHSPFILSDIPKNNILYLEEGSAKDSDEFINPFAANINDILAQSFFLNKGFIGERARRVILDAVEWMTGNRRVSKICGEWTDTQLDCLIDMIGEPLIRNKLAELHGNKRARLAFLRMEQERIAREIRNIEEEE